MRKYVRERADECCLKFGEKYWRQIYLFLTKQILFLLFRTKAIMIESMRIRMWKH